MTQTAMATDDGDDEATYIKTIEAARLLGVTPRTLYRLIDDGRIEAYRYGRVIRVRKGDVQRLKRTMGDDPAEPP